MVGDGHVATGAAAAPLAAKVDPHTGGHSCGESQGSREAVAAIAAPATHTLGIDAVGTGAVQLSVVDKPCADRRLVAHRDGAASTAGTAGAAHGHLGRYGIGSDGAGEARGAAAAAAATADGLGQDAGGVVGPGCDAQTRVGDGDAATVAAGAAGATDRGAGGDGRTA